MKILMLFFVIVQSSFFAENVHANLQDDFECEVNIEGFNTITGGGTPGSSIPRKLAEGLEFKDVILLRELDVNAHRYFPVYKEVLVKVEKLNLLEETNNYGNSCNNVKKTYFITTKFFAARLTFSALGGSLPTGSDLPAKKVNQWVLCKEQRMQGCR